MTRLFDSTILIAHLRGDERATAFLEASLDGGAFASVISRTEIEGGMRSGEGGAVGRLFAAIDLVAVTDSIAARAGRHLRAFRASHRGIDLADYLIGATAEEIGAELVTLNVRHFPMFEGLEPPWRDAP